MKRPILYILIPFCAGIAVCASFPVRVLYSFSAGIIFAAASFFFSSRKALSHAALYLALFFLGASFYQNSGVLPPGHLSNLVPDGSGPRKAVIRGVVIDDPSAEEAFYGGRKISFLLDVSAVKQAERWSPAEGLCEVRIYTKEPRGIEFGDQLTIEGLLSRPSGLKNPGLFDYARYLANKNIYCALKAGDGNLIEVVRGIPSNPVKRLAYKMRRAIRSALERYLDDPDLAFAKAMLIGDRSGLKDELNDDFIKTGTVHIISISGLHVGLIAALVLFLFGIFRIPKKINLLMTVAFLAVYWYVAGSSAPITRAVIMFAVFAFGYVLERESDLLNSLAFAALCILLWNPKQLFDPGFQLSFASMAGIFIFAPKVEALLGLDGRAGGTAFRKSAVYLLKGVAVSVAAWIGTWPIVASYFNIISPVSVVANLVIIPLSFVSMTAAICLLPAGLIPGILPNAVAHGLGIVDGALFAVNHFLAQVPFAYFRIPSAPVWFTVLYYALAILWIVPQEALAAGRFRLRKAHAAAIILLALNICVWTAYARAGGDAVKITFLDVGKGDCAFIEFPQGGNMLIDAGSGGDGGRFDIGRNVVAPYVWNGLARKIDILLITHPHEDHLGGAIYILENFPVGAVIDNGYVEKGKLYERYRRLIKEKGVPRIAVAAGDKICLPRGAGFFVLSPGGSYSPPDTNAGSVVGKLVVGKRSVLFSGDATSDAMKNMIGDYGDFLKSEIIKSPHHGGNIGNEMTAREFFDIVDPQISVISSGAPGPHGARRKNSIAYSENVSYNTGEQGAVVAYIWPEKYYVTAAKNN
jgi:competence protein ComEC